MTRQTTADNLGDAIRNLGGSPKGGRPTKADLLDQLETLVSGGGVSQADVERVVAEMLPDAIDGRIEPVVDRAVADALTEATVDESDLDAIFGD